MKTRAVSSSEFRATGRLDCNFFVSPALAIRSLIDRARASGLTVVSLGKLADSVSQPNRAKKKLASINEKKVGYLRPYDVFSFLPKTTQYVSTSRTSDLAQVQLKKGQILQTCSGRNLGPAALVDDYLAGLVVSNDMLRISVTDPKLRHYLWIYLNSRVGHALLRQNRTGSVIDHISCETVAEINVVLPPNDKFERIVNVASEASTLIENARLTLRDKLAQYEHSLPLIAPNSRSCNGWTVRATNLTGRIDAAFYDPAVTTARHQLLAIGGTELRHVAKVIKPGGRYKTNYLSKDVGIPILSGEQLLQLFPINLKYMSRHVFRELELYKLKENMIAFAADGRAQEDLGTPTIISKHREGWLASGHVSRIIPFDIENTAWIYLAFWSCPY